MNKILLVYDRRGQPYEGRIVKLVKEYEVSYRSPLRYESFLEAEDLQTRKMKTFSSLHFSWRDVYEYLSDVKKCAKEIQNAGDKLL